MDIEDNLHTTKAKISNRLSVWRPGRAGIYHTYMYYCTLTKTKRQTDDTGVRQADSVLYTDEAQNLRQTDDTGKPTSQTDG